MCIYTCKCTCNSISYMHIFKVPVITDICVSGFKGRPYIDQMNDRQVSVHIHLCISMYEYMSIYVCNYICVYTYIRMYMYMNIYIYIYVYI
jgi:hypothetical protein